MDLLLGITIVLAIGAAGVVGLAYAASHTPHGRIHPLFGLAFGVQRVLGAAAGEGVLARPMSTPTERADAREQFLRGTLALSRPTPFAGEVSDRILDGPGGLLRVVVCTPPGDGGPFPLLLYFHGGGFVVGTPAYTDAITRGVAACAPVVTVSVDYRLAPEAPWPAAVEDASFALDWCWQNAAELRVDRARIAVGGDSAGGNLAAVLARRDRDAATRRIALQVLIYPALDSTRVDRASHRAFERGYGLSLRDVEVSLAHYLPPDADRRDPDISPLCTPSCDGLPAALVFTAGFDVLRDEGLEYVQRLQKADVPVDHVHRPDMPHGYLTVTRFCREARSDIARIASSVAGATALSRAR